MVSSPANVNVTLVLGDGSANQGLYFLTPRGQADAGRFTAPNTVEIRLTRDALSVNGWPGAKVVQRW